MAVVNAKHFFEAEIPDTDFSGYISLGTNHRFFNNIKEKVGSKTYKDKYVFNAESEGVKASIIFYGDTLTVGADGLPKGGTITAFRQVQSETSFSDPVDFTISSVSISFVSMYRAMKTENPSDDIAIARAIYAGNDRMTLSNDTDTAHGYGGNDVINGRGGADELFGGKGNDILIGGRSGDQLTGGTGADKFQYNSAATDNSDHILDFSRAEHDRITFKSSGYGDLAKGKIARGMFRSLDDGNTPIDKNDYFIFNKSDDSLWYAPDGSDNNGARTLVIDFDTNVDLRYDDIRII
jgi:Ca2+-binding RTX toxin-like protein